LQPRERQDVYGAAATVGVERSSRWHADIRFGGGDGEEKGAKKSNGAA
jgi:hypothetical protein